MEIIFKIKKHFKRWDLQTSYGDFPKGRMDKAVCIFIYGFAYVTQLLWTFFILLVVGFVVVGILEYIIKPILY